MKLSKCHMVFCVSLSGITNLDRGIISIDQRAVAHHLKRLMIRDPVEELNSQRLKSQVEKTLTYKKYWLHENLAEPQTHAIQQGLNQVS